MSFTIRFDYRFDSNGFFDDPDRRAALEEAGLQWARDINDEFDDVPAGTTFDIRNPTTRIDEAITLTEAIDDITIFVGATNLPGSTLAVAGPDGSDAAGDVYAARVSYNFRDTGPVTDFEPWAGSITFDTNTDWYFGLDALTGRGSDFLSVAVHEIGHILGVGASAAFDALIVGDAFVGPNAQRINGGRPIPLESDGSHVEDGFADNTVSLDPSLTNSTRVLVSDYDRAMLADIGYDVTGFTKQGETPAIATASSERIFGRDVGDAIDALGGNDTLQGGGGDDHLSGNDGDDDIFGQAGEDTLFGGTGDDYLGGGPGDDALWGGAGKDNYFGEGGTDVFVIGLGDGENIISDFDLTIETIRLIDSGFASAQEAASAVTKTAGNVSRLTLSDGTTVDVFHASQGGTPLTARHFEMVDASVLPVTMPDDGGGSVHRENGVLVGTSGNDDLVATTGLVHIDGLAGVDTVRFGGDPTDYTLTFSPEGVSITDRSEPGIGTVALENVELIAFGSQSSAFDGPLDLRSYGGHADLSEGAFESFVEMYIAYFNRAPDAIGLSFWATSYANGTPLEEIARLFSDQPETRATYPADTTNIQFAAEVYENVLGRTPDVDGLRFWTNALDEGVVSRSEFILDVLLGVKATPPADATFEFLARQLADRLYLEQKVDLGAMFAVHRGMSNVDDAATVMAQFDGSDESFEGAVETIETLYSAAMVGETGEFLMPLVGVLDDPFVV